MSLYVLDAVCMQQLDVGALQAVADRLPIHDARRFGQTFAAARTAASASLVQRPKWHFAAYRATRVQSQRSRDIMAVITRSLDALAKGNVPVDSTSVLGFKGLETQVGSVRGTIWIPGHVVDFRMTPKDQTRATLLVRLPMKTIARPDRAIDAFAIMSFKISTEHRRVSVTGRFPPSVRAYPYVCLPVVTAVRRAFKANGYSA